MGIAILSTSSGVMTGRTAEQKGIGEKRSASSGDETDMSRIGRQPIELPAGVNVAVSPGRIQVNGPLGELSQQLPSRITVTEGGGEGRSSPG